MLVGKAFSNQMSLEKQKINGLSTSRVLKLLD